VENRFREHTVRQHVRIAAAEILGRDHRDELALWEHVNPVSAHAVV
jgi:hypothetical protein